MLTNVKHCCFFIPHHLKKCGVLCYTRRKKIAFEGPSVQTLFPGSIFQHLLTNFLQTLYMFISGMSCLGLKMGKLCQISTELWLLIYVKILFPGSYLEHLLTKFLQTCCRVHIGKKWSGIEDG